MSKPELKIIGWREWIHLHQLGIKNIKAKIDTGARTSALHAFEVEPFTEDNKQRVRFLMHPYQKNTKVVAECFADVIDRRMVTDSGGHSEERIVISTPLTVGPHTWDAEITLTNRDTMKFRMLLGRTAMKNRFLVNPALSYCFGDEI